MKLNKAKHRISGKAVVSLLYYGYGGTIMDYRIEKRESRFAIDPSGKDRPNKIFFIPFYEPFVPCTPKKTENLPIN